MSKKIYVGNLNYETTDEQISELFAQYGNVVSAVVIYDRATNRSKGFGFVEMEDNGAAEAAVSALNGMEFQGRALRVNEAREQAPRRQNNY